VTSNPEHVRHHCRGTCGPILEDDYGLPYRFDSSQDQNSSEPSWPPHHGRDLCTASACCVSVVAHT